MKFPHAYHGVKLLFLAEIISIAAAVVAMISAIIATLVVSGSQSAAAGAATLVLVSAVSGIL